MSTNQLDNNSLNDILSGLETPLSTEERVNYLSTLRQYSKSISESPRNFEEFSSLNPNASEADKANFLLQRQNTNQAHESLVEQGNTARRNLNRDEASDVLAPSAKGVIGLGQIVYGAADMLSRLSPLNRTSEYLNANFDTNVPLSLDEGVGRLREFAGGERRGIAQDFGKSREIIDKNLASDFNKQQRTDIQLNQENFGKKSDLEMEEQIKAGKAEWLAQANNIGRKALNTAKSYIDAPNQIFEQVIEEIPQLLLGGAVGKKTVEELSKTVNSLTSPAAAKRYLNSKAGIKKAEKIAATVGVGTAAISEAMSNAVETRAKVEQYTEKQLTEESPLYNKIRASGIGHEEAKRVVANLAVDLVTGFTLPLAAVSSKLTGAGKLEGTIFTPKSALSKSILGTLKDSVGKPVAGALREGVEETIQSGGGQFIQNFALSESAKENQKLTENVGEALGQGAIVGMGSGLTLGSIASLPSTSRKAVTASSKGVRKAVIEAGRVVGKLTDDPQVREAVSSGDASVVTNEKSDTYSPEKAYTTLMRKEFVPIQDVENNESDENYKERVNNYSEELKKHILNQRDALGALVEDESENTQKAFEEWDKSAQVAKNIISILKNEDISEKVEAIFNSEDPKEIDDNKQSVLASMDLGFDAVPVEKATKLLESDKLTEVEKNKVKSYIEVSKAYEALSSLPEVAKAVLEGSEGFLGLKDYKNLISSAVSKNDKERGEKVLGLLKDLQNSHNKKRVLFESAFKKSIDTSKNVVFKHNNKNYTIHRGSGSLVNAVIQESNAIDKVQSALVNEFNSVFTDSKIKNEVVEPSSQETLDAAPVSQEEVTPASNEPVIKESVPVESKTTSKPSTVEKTTQTPTDVDTSPKIEPESNAEDEVEADLDLVNDLVSEISKPDITIDRLVGKTTVSKDTVVTKLDNTIKGYPELKTSLKNIVNDLTDVTGKIGRKKRSTLERSLNILTKRFSNLNIPLELQDAFNVVKKAASTINVKDDVNTINNSLNEVEDALNVFEDVAFDYENNKELSKSPNKVNNNELANYILPSKNKNILNNVRGFIDTLTEDNDLGIKNVKELQKYRNSFRSALNRTIKLNKNSDYLKDNLTALTIDADKYKGETTEVGNALDDNLLDAMVFASLNWYGTRGESTLTPDEGFIKRSLGIDSNSKLPREAWGLLGKAGMDSFVVKKSLGQDVFNAIGFRVNPDAPKGSKEHFINSLGEYVFAAMHHLDGMESRSIKANLIHDILGTSKEARKALKITPYTEYKYTKAKVSNSLDFGVNFISENEDAIENLFNIRNPNRLPSFSAITKIPKKSKAGDRNLSKDDRKAIGIQQSLPYKLNGELVNLIHILGKNFALKMEGLVENLDSVHEVDLEGTKGKNHAIERSYDDFMSFVDLVEEKEKGVETPFYFRFNAMSNNRTMIDSNRVNFQAHKFQRHLMYMDSWDTTVDSEIKRDLYLLALGQSMGVGIDKQTLGASIEETKLLIDNPIVRDAVEVLRKVNKTGEVSEGDPSKVLKAVQLGKEKTHSFAGLVSLMNYSADRPFQTRLFLEVDGVTNGTAIALMQMASYGVEGTLKALEKVGIYSKEYQTYGQFKEAGGLDNYETLSNTMQNIALKGDLDINSEMARSVGNLLGKPKFEDRGEAGAIFVDRLYGLLRNVAKNPVMVGNYGAGITKIISEFSEEVIDAIYTKLAKYANEGNQGALDLLQKDLEKVTGEKLNRITVNNAKDKNILASHNLDKIRNNVSNSLGKVMEEALNAEFGPIAKDRSNLNDLVNRVNAAFINIYDEKVKEKKKEKSRNYITIQENADILEDLERLTPKIGHATSESRDTYLNLVTTEKRASEVAVVTKYKEGLKNTVSSKTGGLSKQSRDFVEESNFTDVGVKGVVLAVQSTDAANMHQAYLNSPSKEFMNVFDAVIAGLGNITEISDAINEAMYSNSVNYDIYDAFYASMEQAFSSMDSKEKQIFQKEFTKVNYVNGEKQSGQASLNALKDMKANKEKVLANIVNVRQYNLETSSFNVKGTDKGSVKDKVEALVSGLKEKNNNVLGSSANTPNKGYSNIVSEFEVESSTIEGILTKLRYAGAVKSSNKHHAHLVNLMGNLYNDLINPIKVKQAESSDETSGYFDLNAKEINININKNTRVSSIEMGADEVLSHEMVHAITQVALEKNNKVARQVAKLFRDAKRVMTPEDFMGANGNLKDAEARYNYVFNNPNKTKGTNYSVGIHEFVAMGVTNEAFMSKLSAKLNQESYLEGNTLLEKMFNVYLKAVNVIKNLFERTAGISHDRDLVKLVRDLATYEEKGKQKSFIHEFQQKMDSKAAGALKQYILEPLINLTEKDFLAKNDIKYVKGVIRGASALVNVTARGNFNELRKKINKVAYRLGLTENNLMVALLNETAGRVDENNWAFELARTSNKLLDQTRAEIIANVQKHLTKVFTKELTVEEEIAVTKVLLDTDMAQLMTEYNSEQIGTLLTDSKYLFNELKKTEKELNAFGTDATYYRRMAKSLANYMITGRFKESAALMNAQAIANLALTGRDIPAHSKQAEKVIDKLASLEALRIVKLDKEKEFNIIKDLAVNEFEHDTVENGITFVLGMMQDFKEKSLKDLFNGNKMLTVKGYRKEIFDPSKSFAVVSEIEVDEMEKDGFVLFGEVGKDVHDINKNTGPMYLMVNDNGGLATWMAGGVSTSRLEGKGTNYFETLTQLNREYSKSRVENELNDIKLAKKQAALDIYAGKGSPVEQTTLVPTLDGKGNVTNFRYLMKDSVKDEALNRDERFSHVLGATEGNFISKINGKDINERYVEAMYQDYVSDYTKDPEAYVYIGDKASGEYLDLWRLMPSAMQQDVLNKFGEKGLYVKRDLVKVIFGQRKFVLNTWAQEKQKVIAMRDDVVKPLLNPLLKVLGSKQFGNAEQMWKELVTIVKDTIVIKSIEVLLGNVTSNNILLWTLGVPVTEIASRQAEAVTFAEQYQTDRERLLDVEREIKVKTKLRSSKASVVKLRSEKTMLEDSLERNPVRDLIESGIYQSIIEDVEQVNSEFSYSTKLEKWVSPVTDKVPSSVKTLAKNVAITQDTKIYKFMRRATQLSDFAARYALHVTNMDNGMSREASLNRIEDVFVNYDLPTHKSIQYLNDIGGLFFTKFFIRIQKIIYHTMVNNPARILGLTFIQDLFGNLSDIADSSVILRDIFNMFNLNPVEVVDGIVDTHPMLYMVR